jgi:hypothetical protein
MGDSSHIKKVLYNEVAFVVAIVGVAFGVINWIYSPAKQMDKDISLIQKDIAVINNNHLTHLQNYAEEIKNMRGDGDRQEEQIILMDKKLDVIIYRLDEINK